MIGGALGIALVGSLEVRGMDVRSGEPGDTPSTRLQEGGAFEGSSGDAQEEQAQQIKGSAAYRAAPSGDLKERVSSPSLGEEPPSRNGEDEEAVPTGASSSSSASLPTTKLLTIPFLLKEEESKWIGLEQEKEVAEASTQRKSDLESQQEELLEGVLSRLVSRITAFSQGNRSLQIDEPTLRNALEPLKRTLRNKLQLQAGVESEKSDEELEALRERLEAENQTSSNASSIVEVI